MNTPLPRAVQAQVDRAEELLQSRQAPPAPAPAPVEPPAPAPAPVEPPPTPPAPPTPAPNSEAAVWEQRYRSLQGMFNQQQEQNRVNVQQLADQIAALTQQLAAQAKPPAPAPAPVAITPQDREAFGDPLVDMVQRGTQAVLPQVQQMIQQAVAPLQEQLPKVAQQVQQTAQAAALTAREQFFVSLDAARPDWETINGRADWLAWLGEADPMTGVPRQAILDDAINSQSLQRTLAVFNAFAPAQAPTPAPTPAPAAPPVSPAPRSVGANVVPTSRDEGTAPTITRGEIAKFYADVAQGKYRSRTADQAAMEKRINDAVAAGRVAH